MRRQTLLTHQNLVSSATALWLLLVHLFACHPGNSFALGMSASGDSFPTTSTSLPEKGGLVLVTGGSRGIGRATCLLLASLGYNVAIADTRPAESVVQEIEEMKNNEKGKAMAFVADISDEEQVSKLFSDVSKSFGMDPTGLVNNAGVMEKMEKDICNIDRATLDADFGSLLLLQRVCPPSEHQQGRYGRCDCQCFIRVGGNWSASSIWHVQGRAGIHAGWLVQDTTTRGNSHQYGCTWSDRHPHGSQRAG